MKCILNSNDDIRLIALGIITINIGDRRIAAIDSELRVI